MDANFLWGWCSLLGAPIVALATVIFARAHSHHRTATIAAGIWLLLIVGSVYGFSFVAMRTNLLCLLLAYFAYSFLAAMCLWDTNVDRSHPGLPGRRFPCRFRIFPKYGRNTCAHVY